LEYLCKKIKIGGKMTKNLFILFVLVAFLVSCNNTQNKTTETTDQETAEEIAMLTIKDFDNVAEKYVGKEVQIKGLVNHTCKHGGKRMFIIDEETEQTVKIEAGENISSFDAELEGSVVQVNGIVNELIIDEAYLMEWEEELKAEMAENEEAVEGETEESHEQAEGEEHEHEHASGGLGEKADMGEHVSGFEKIADYRKEIAESDKDYLAFYSIECISYEVIPETEEE
jgi:hypothetical protein